MRTIFRLSLTLLLGTLGSAAFAGDFDGTKKLICAPVQAMACAAGADCESGTPDEMGAPAFMRIDFAKKQIVGPKRSTTIRAMDQDDKQLLLQGTELGMAWTLALDAGDGRMTLTFGNRNGAFVLFGNCTPL